MASALWLAVMGDSGRLARINGYFGDLIYLESEMAEWLAVHK